MKRACLGVAVVMVWLALVGVATADDGPLRVIASGGSVRPMKNTSIRMAAETVQAICYSRFAEYKVDFRFENTSATTTTVLLGFPFRAPYYEPVVPPDRYFAPGGFRAWQDGRPLAVALAHGHESGDNVDYYTHTAIFPPGESTVTVDYLISPEFGGGQELSDFADQTDGLVTSTPPAYRNELIGEGEYDYTLHSGSYWKGTIGLAVLRWTLSPDFIGWGIEQEAKYYSSEDTSDPDYEPDAEDLMYDRIQSHYTTPTPRAYQWTIRDFEPALNDDDTSPYDIGLLYLAPPLDSDPDTPNAYRLPSATASSHLTLAPYSYPAGNLVDGDPSSAWAEGAPGTGIGQWLDVTFPRTRQLRELRIVSGYAKRPEIFARYNRPKRLRFDFSDGTSRTITLADSPSLQRFPVSASAKKVRVTVLAVYRGTTRNETYISEIDFGQALAPTFEDPGALLASVRSVPSADATPNTQAPPPSVATPAPADGTRSATREPIPADPVSPIYLVVLAATLVGVTAVMWRQA